MRKKLVLFFIVALGFTGLFLHWKLNSQAAGGDFIFAKRPISIGLFDTATDSNGRIVVAGQVMGSKDLNGDGDTSDAFEDGAPTSNSGDIFFSVYDSSGAYQFSRRLGGNEVDYGNAVAVDSSDNIYVLGLVTGNGDLNADGDSTDGGAETASGTGFGYYTPVLVKYDSGGNYLWSQRWGIISNPWPP